MPLHSAVTMMSSLSMGGTSSVSDVHGFLFIERDGALKMPTSWFPGQKR